MKRSSRYVYIIIFLLLGLYPCPSLPQGPFPDAHDQPPLNWNPDDPIFHLSQSYPKNVPIGSTAPWSGIKFTKDPQKYMSAVLEYVYEGNVSVGWRVEKNPIRPWYHAPWMHWGDNGREFIHGMTRERRSRPCELSCTQTKTVQNWAVSMYNDLGGYALGQVWANPSAPNPSAARFPVGTVAVKLLFSQATPDAVPFLQGAPEWNANIISLGEPGIRRVQPLRLLQIDVAIRDDRANPWTGWVFGTFQYDGSINDPEPWNRVVPIGLTWGNKKNPPEFWINHAAPFVVYRDSLPAPLGWEGRLNGPVDNQKSSCLSCHSTAQYPVFADLLPSFGADPALWFRNLKPGEAFGQAFNQPSQSLDFSLQLAAGIQNFYEWIASVQGLGARGSISIPPVPVDSDETCCPKPGSASKIRKASPVTDEARRREFKVDRDEDGTSPRNSMPSHEVFSPPY